MNESITVEQQEWESVCAIATALAPYESARQPGVVLAFPGGTRWWTFTTPGLRVDLPGADGALSDSFRLPTVAVVAASDLASIEGSCELGIDGGDVLVRNRQGSVRTNAARPVEMRNRPARTPVRQATTAQVPVDRLWWILDLAGNGDGGGPERLERGEVVLTIGDGSVSVIADWGRFGPTPPSFGIPASTIGRASVRFATRELVALLAAVTEEVDLHLEVDLRRSLLWIDASHWSAVLNVGVVQSDRLVGVGPDHVFEVYERGGGEVEVNRCAVVVTAEPEGTFHASVRVATGHSLSPTLLSELNAWNSNPGGVRLWFSDGSVWAGCTVTDPRPLEVARSTSELVERASELGVLFSLLDDEGQAESR